MCGLFGILKTNKTFFQDSTITKAFREGMHLSGFRGVDGAGIIAKHDNSILFYKKPYPVYDFLSLEITRNMLGNIHLADYVLAHTRKTTSGNNTQDATHPYTSEHIMLMHNGCITEIDSKTMYSEKADYLSDSHWLTMKLDKNVEDYKTFLENVKGEYALTWVNVETKDVFIVRNKHRPLFMVQLEDYLMYASEIETLDYLIFRHDLKLKSKSTKIEEVKENTLFKFSDKTLTEEFTFKSPPERQVQVYNYNNYYKSNTHNDPPSGPLYTKEARMFFTAKSVASTKRRMYVIRGMTAGGSVVVGNSSKEVAVGDNLVATCTGYSISKEGNFTYMVKDISPEDSSRTETRAVTCQSCQKYVEEYSIIQGYTVCNECMQYQQ